MESADICLRVSLFGMKSKEMKSKWPIYLDLSIKTSNWLKRSMENGKKYQYISNWIDIGNLSIWTMFILFWMKGLNINKY